MFQHNDFSVWLPLGSPFTAEAASSHPVRIFGAASYEKRHGLFRGEQNVYTVWSSKWTSMRPAQKKSLISNLSVKSPRTKITAIRECTKLEESRNHSGICSCLCPSRGREGAFPTRQPGASISVNCSGSTGPSLLHRQHYTDGILKTNSCKSEVDRMVLSDQVTTWLLWETQVYTLLNGWKGYLFCSETC